MNIRNVITFILCFAFLSVSAQGVADYGDAFMKRKPGIMRHYSGFKPYDENSAVKFDRLNTDFYFNSWLGETNNVKTKFYAIGHNINLMWDLPFGQNSRFGVAFGLGYSHFNVRNNGAFSFISDPSGSYTSLDTYVGPKRWINRTVFNFVEIPFELRIRAKRERGKFKFYPGFKAGFMVENYIKWRIESKEFKEFNFPDLNRIHFGPTLRIGVDNVMLFAHYDLAPLFTNPNSNKLQLFAAGISIGWF